MSELKWNWAYLPYLDPPEGQKESALKAGYIKVVDKSEADKVIAELKALKAQAEDDCAYWKSKAQRERHANYKRCLAMARWCKRNRLHACVCGPVEKIDFWEKWHKRWLELAEQFNPNSTATKENNNG